MDAQREVDRGVGIALTPAPPVVGYCGKQRVRRRGVNHLMLPVANRHQTRIGQLAGQTGRGDVHAQRPRALYRQMKTPAAESALAQRFTGVAQPPFVQQFFKNVTHRRNRQAGELRQLRFTELLFAPQMRQEDLFIRLSDTGVIESRTLHTLNSLNYIA
ncbi:hypothetical protein SDC9_168550 [bioreactor metagenome]|uniref:Uncharacterized protein n=1 Tax=bioreactor metagenome TaxID=1076179 RepID=A0A645G2V1_9ZZZZ